MRFTVAALGPAFTLRLGRENGSARGARFSDVAGATVLAGGFTSSTNEGAGWAIAGFGSSAAAGIISAAAETEVVCACSALFVL